jgi:hypothetical protein
MSIIFGDITPCSPVNSTDALKECITCVLLFSYLAYYCTLKMEAVPSYEILVDFYPMKLYYNLEDNELHSNSCKNLKSNRIFSESTIPNFTEIYPTV